MTAPTRLLAEREVSAVGCFGPHHDGSDLYVGTARPSIGDAVPIRIRVLQGTGVDTVRVGMIQDGEPAALDADRDLIAARLAGRAGWHRDSLRKIDLAVTGGAIVVPGDGPTAGIWRLG